MNDLAVVNLDTGELVSRSGGGDVVAFEPKEALTKQAKFDAVIEYAQRVRDWPLMEQAVDQKVEHQRELVGWWRAHVRSQGEHKKKSPEEGFLTVKQLENLTKFSDTQVAKWAKRLKEPDKYKKKLFDAAYKAAMAMVAGNLMSETNEWYTPEEYIASVRAVFGGEIDLDPASCDSANRVVQAANIFTEKDRGETREWFGRVFMNPPYGTDKGESRAGKFCNKAIGEYQAGRVSECIILVNSVHAQGWQRPLYDFPLCLVDHRIQFMDSEGEINPNPTFMNLFAYLGPNKEAFAREFSKHGYVVERLQCS